MSRKPRNKATFSISLNIATTKYLFSLIESGQARSVSDAIEQLCSLIYSGKLLPEKVIKARALEMFEQWKREQEQAEKEAELNAEVQDA